LHALLFFPALPGSSRNARTLCGFVTLYLLLVQQAARHSRTRNSSHLQMQRVQQEQREAALKCLADDLGGGEHLMTWMLWQASTVQQRIGGDEHRA